MSTIQLDPKVWKKIKTDLRTEYPASVFMIRSRMRDTLGFTVREHNAWTNDGYLQLICLDFYSERKYTMFLLKYSEFIKKDVT